MTAAGVVGPTNLTWLRVHTSGSASVRTAKPSSNSLTRPASRSSVFRVCALIRPRTSLGSATTACSLPIAAAALLEEIGLLARDPVEERLEAEPAGQVRADLRCGQARHLRADLDRRARRGREELRLARPLHRDEPPRRLLDGVPDGQQAVVAEDGRLVAAEGVGDPLALLEVEDDPGVVVEHRVVLVEGADVLGDGLER